MSHLDEELALAATERDAVAPLAAPREPDRQSPRRNLGLLFALLAVGALVLLLVFNSLEGAVVYSKGVDDLLSQGEQLVGRNIRVEGKLVSGSLRKRDKPCEFRFELTKNGATVPVRYAQCIVPDTFRDVPGMAVDVTAEGQLASAGHFDAKQIMAKCPSKYEEQAKSGVSVPYDRPIPSLETDVEGSTSKR